MIIWNLDELTQVFNSVDGDDLLEKCKEILTKQWTTDALHFKEPIAQPTRDSTEEFESIKNNLGEHLQELLHK